MLRKFLNTQILFLAILLVVSACQPQKKESESTEEKTSKGPVIGLITYSWRSMPSSMNDMINYCKQSGITSLELMGYSAEEFAGIPKGPKKPGKGASLEEKDEYAKANEIAKAKQRDWRLSVSMDKYKEIRKTFNDAGINIHIVKFAPAKWTDEEIDYAFRAAKALGAVGITNEIGHDAAKRLGKFAEKHDMYAIFHNHAQPGQPGFSFDEFLAYSPNNMLNLDVGHYFGSTGKHPNEIIERLHDRIISLHLKDKTSNTDDPPNSNKVWGQAGTPLAEIIQLIQKNNWPIHCDIEVEYKIPNDSDAVKESKKCVDFCKKALM
ncbi:MAG: sugar phosphate isomerase/epimerase [Cyclobacteriaceae bacterium]